LDLHQPVARAGAWPIVYANQLGEESGPLIDNQVLLAVEHVRHRIAGLRSRHAFTY